MSISEARPDPDHASLTGWLIPRHATTVAPPQYDSAKQICSFDAVKNIWTVKNIPVQTDITPTKEELDAESALGIRVARDRLLHSADIKINMIEDSGKSAKAWRTYRQALRDVTKQSTFPTSVIWPKLP